MLHLMRLLPVRFLFCLALAGGAALPQTLRIMTFNVRYPAKTDGPDRWEFRRDLLVDTIREKSPDLIGTQELYYEQGQYIVEKLPDYVWFGISRRGNHEDEHMGVFYKKDRLRLLDSGNFWLSETPETPGSMSWGVNLPRMVTWGLFEIREAARRFYLYNTHFPHRREDEEARLRAARLLSERLQRLDPSIPLVLTGDFNAAAGGEVYRVFTTHLEDAWARAPKRSGPECTAGGFQGRTDCRRIDWILYRGALRPLEAETVRRSRDGRFPSDHYPVLAVFELAAP